MSVGNNTVRHTADEALRFPLKITGMCTHVANTRYGHGHTRQPCRRNTKQIRIEPVCMKHLNSMLFQVTGEPHLRAKCSVAPQTIDGVIRKGMAALLDFREKCSTFAEACQMKIEFRSIDALHYVDELALGSTDHENVEKLQHSNPFAH